MRAPSLELIEAGVISVEEGGRRLEALAGAADPPEPAPAPAPSVDRPVWVRWVWQAVFWTGDALLSLGAPKVNVTAPMGLVGAGLRVAQRFAPEFNGFDMEELEELLASGADGKLVEVVDEEDNDMDFKPT
jgi:hypothetical protein